MDWGVGGRVAEQRHCGGQQLSVQDLLRLSRQQSFRSECVVSHPEGAFYQKVIAASPVSRPRNRRPALRG